MTRGAVLFFVLISLVSGCGQSGPKEYPVTGTVTYQGEPLLLGTVMFVPKEGPAATATIGNDGRYRLEAVPGEHSVGIIAMPPRPGGRPDPAVEGGIDYTGVPEVESLIPEKYNRFHTSGVAVVVEAKAANQVDIHLEPK